MIKGIFEVHLITEPQYQTQLFGYITNLKNERLIRPRPTCAHALYGDYPIQPMLTFMVNGFLDEVTTIVSDIEKDMNVKQIPTIRTKIESMAHNEGVPENCSDDNYFEYHFKVGINGTKQWNDIVKLVMPFGAHLFYNPYNKTLNPIVTLRRYNSLDELDSVYNKVKVLLENNGFTLTSLEREYSVYDSNVNLDKNWLFQGEPTNFIDSVNNNMLFAY